VKNEHVTMNESVSLRGRRSHYSVIAKERFFSVIASAAKRREAPPLFTRGGTPPYESNGGAISNGERLLRRRCAPPRNDKSPVAPRNDKIMAVVHRKLNSEKGSVLILVLWALFFLGMLSLAIRAHVQPQLSLAQKLLGRAKMYYLASAGVERAILEVENDSAEYKEEDKDRDEEEPYDYDALNDLWGNNEKAFKDIETDGGTFSIVNIVTANSEGRPLKEPGIRYGLTDEESRININKVPKSVLASFFELAADLDEDEAAEIAASIEDWRDEDDDFCEDGAEGEDYYEKLEAPYPAKNADFGVPEELLMVKGVTREIFDSVKDGITVYGAGAVNINTADARVLQGLGMDKKLVRKIIHFRRGSDGTEGTRDDNVFKEAGAITKDLTKKERTTGSDNSLILRLVAGELLSVRSDNFKGRARGSMKGRQGFLEIVFVYDRADNMIQYWDEVNTK